MGKRPSEDTLPDIYAAAASRPRSNKPIIPMPRVGRGSLNSWPVIIPMARVGKRAARMTSTMDAVKEEDVDRMIKLLERWLDRAKKL